MKLSQLQLPLKRSLHKCKNFMYLDKNVTLLMKVQRYVCNMYNRWQNSVLRTPKLHECFGWTSLKDCHTNRVTRDESR